MLIMQTLAQLYTLHYLDTWMTQEASVVCYVDKNIFQTHCHITYHTYNGWKCHVTDLDADVYLVQILSKSYCVICVNIDCENSWISYRVEFILLHWPFFIHSVLQCKILVHAVFLIVVNIPFQCLFLMRNQRLCCHLLAFEEISSLYISSCCWDLSNLSNV